MFGFQPLSHQLKTNENQNKKQMQFLTIDSKPSQLKFTQRFQKITQDLDQSFSSRNQQNTKDNLNKSKVKRKDTQQTDPSQSKISSKNQIQSNNQPMSNLIQKSQNDPFIRRKLKALMDNNLKSLKKLNDQTGKTFTQCSSKTSLFNDPQDNVTSHQNAVQTQYTRIPKDIGKIIKNNCSKQSNISIKKMSSQPYLNKLVPNKLLHKLTLPDNEEQIRKQKSFTTLRKQAYKKKIQNLEILKQVPDQKLKNTNKKD